MTNIGLMAELTLREFLKTNTQQIAAEALGCNRSAISQMLTADRDIRFRTDIDGNVLEVFEVKKPGKRKSA